uniref:Ig-like domain-containing protein n=1 Tax=Parastrongyloides trichosuri TaxID=131310 RepID=A0A0N4ZQK7_PARTI
MSFYISIFNNYNIKELLQINDILIQPGFEKPFEQFAHVKFRNKLKIYEVNYSDFSDIDNTNVGTGIYLSNLYLQTNINNFFIFGKDNKFQKFQEMVCNIHFCNWGVILIDDEINIDTLNSVNEISMIDYGIIIKLRTISNELSLGLMNYNDMNIKISACPNIGWVHESGVLEYQPTSYIKNHNFTDLFNQRIHLLTPIYNRHDNLNFFICGVIKQYGLNDLNVGYKILRNNDMKEYGVDIDVSENKLVCNDITESNQFYYFGYIKKEKNYRNEEIMEMIDMTILNKDKLYLDQTIFFYSKDLLRIKIQNIGTENQILENNFQVEPTCLRKVSGEIKATLIPTTGDLELLKYHEPLQLYYLFIQGNSMNNKQNVVCLSDVENDKNRKYDQFYSRSAEISISKNGQITEIGPILDMNIFGVYTCQVSKKTKAFKNSGVKIAETLILPENGFQFIYEDVVVSKNKESKASCIQSYDKWATLSLMKLSPQNYPEKSIIVNEFVSNDVTWNNNNTIIFKKKFSLTKIEVTCTYTTLLETSFSTKQKFLYSKSSKPKNTSFGLSALLIGIGFIIVLSILSVIAVLYIKKRKRKRKEKEAAMANSVSSSFSKSSGGLVAPSRTYNKTIVHGKKTMVFKAPKAIYNTNNNKKIIDAKCSTMTTNINIATSYVTLDLNNENNATIKPKK